MDIPRQIVEPKDFQDYWGYKYVRFADGRVLFCDAADFGFSHKQIVASYSAVPPVSAGQIRVRKRQWAITDGGSTTANLPRCQSDEKYIAKELGSEFTHDPGLNGY